MTNSRDRFANLKRNQYVLYIALFSLVTAVIWITGSLVSSQQKTGISPHLLEMAKPLNPNINHFVIEAVEAKRTFSFQELQDFEIFKVEVEEDNRRRSQQQAPSPVASATPEPEIVPEAQSSISE
jgi:hypothetical protein